MKECVSEYIQTKCLEDTAFARLILHPRKSMVHCFQYINRKSYDYIQDELKASGFKPGPDATAYAVIFRMTCATAGRKNISGTLTPKKTRSRRKNSSPAPM